MKIKNVFKVSLFIYPLIVLMLLIFLLLVSCDSNRTNKVVLEKNYSPLSKPYVPLSKSTVKKYPFKECFFIASEKHNLKPEYLAAVASVESSFNPSAKSPANAIGIMQIRWPLTAKELGVTDIKELYNPCKNIDLGAKYLAMLEHRFDSRLLALSAYFEGPTKVSRNKIISTKSINYIERILNREKMLNNSL